MGQRQAKGVTVGAVAEALDGMAPPALAQDWDNVGLLIGDPRAACRRVLLCIDLTAAVLGEAVGGLYQLIVSYHPPLFRPVQRILADSAEMDSVIHGALAKGLAVYSPHTALDAAPGGTNDVMAGLCGLQDVLPFEHVAGGPAGFKVVTFVPAGDVERVSSAMFAAGAGRIGDYEQCSFRLEGEGTFFGTEGTHPQVGRKGRLERVREVRIELVVPQGRLADVVAALRASHPYEEPAFDVYPLAAVPAGGMGRVGILRQVTTVGGLAELLKKKTRSRVVTIVGSPRTRVRRVAVCVGAAGRLPLERPAAAEADVIVTGEIRHHDALAILRAGKAAIALGHWESERPVLRPLAKRLAAAVAGLEVKVSRRDAGPFGWV